MSHAQKPRLAVISPFLDKSHGSERIMLEWLSHLPDSFEIHIYSQRVEDVDLSSFQWHRIPELPGPHLFNFLWWLAASHLLIGWDRRFRGLRHHIVFSSGANYPGADAICIHIIFAEYVRRMERGASLLRNPVWRWPRLIHRKLYYRLACLLEKRAYPDPNTTLIVHSQKTADELNQHYGRRDQVRLLYPGVEHSKFSPEVRAALRNAARKALELETGHFAAIMIGNDWRNKGVPVLLEAMEQLRDIPIRLLIVSREDPSGWWKLAREKGLDERVRLLPPRKNVEFYYAAADVYAGPSLQDSYAMPPAEAMACGLPVIVSAAAGISEIVTSGTDGLVLNDPRDAAEIATMIRRLYGDVEFRNRLGENAAATMRQYTWERNGRELAAIFDEILERKSRFEVHAMVHER
ncbi:MAG: glycosyltransferase family 4 protein [Candidatus Acidiferrales bacterium]